MRHLAVVLTIALVFASPAGAGASQDTKMLTGTSILDQRAALDGTSVTFEGEAIGEALHADNGGVWLSVLSDGTALGVYLPADQAEVIETYGDYNHTGDTVRVSGEYHRACKQHGGDMDIHATSIEVVARGSVQEHPIDSRKAIIAAAGFVVAGASAAYARRKRRIIEGD